MRLVTGRIAELLDIDQSDDARADGTVEIGPFTFVVSWKGSGLAGPVAKAIEKVQASAAELSGAVPLVAVPFMGEAGRERCAAVDIAWMDLSGNARIFATGLRILVEGKPNLFKRRGRPSSPFAPKGSRIARWLLMNPGEALTQRGIARASGTGEGYTSKIVGRLQQDGLLVKDTTGVIRPCDLDLLLDSWCEAYDFSKHHIIRGHIAARSGDVLLRQLSDSLKKASVEYAATGLAAAWLMDRFAAFRTTTLYLAADPASEQLDALSFREEERGANVWLVVPNDRGVFHGATDVEGIRCVHPVQIYLDLGAHPERAAEAAKRLRDSRLNWRRDA